ncbi:NT-3 growth factor receptor [Collichthys lucidus]|uniref:NT-3 growth factor receptor n=1 Tax=Collichthys lucidus TaxID=240159 RepID=A0A4U5UH38_COLLU|nr:NT-3 growth factor receptor [Collichthys lucidus]TKS74065.1 NT-3 growth factor receptor [Collichthys lucidus]
MKRKQTADTASIFSKGAVRKKKPAEAQNDRQGEQRDETDSESMREECPFNKSEDLNRDNMDVFDALFGAFGVRRSPRIRRCWRLFFLLSVLFHNYMSFLLDCPPTCSCSPTEIYCNKSDNSKFFPLLSFQGTGSAGNSTGSIEDLYQNITSM